METMSRNRSDMWTSLKTVLTSRPNQKNFDNREATW